MNLLKIFGNLSRQVLEKAKDFLVPEEKKMGSLLKIEASAMRFLLPKSPVSGENVFVLFNYKNKIVQLLVKAIKYKNNEGARKRIAQYFYEEMVDIFSDIALFEGSMPILVPMPMSKKEKAKRGFNQCEEVVKEIKRIGGKNIEMSFDALKKIKETKRQTKLDKKSREKNVVGCMTAEDSLVRGKVVAVLDDVYTTGSTMLESRRALLKAGAKRVIHFFIAH